MRDRTYHIALLLLGHAVFLTLTALAYKYAVMRSTFGDTAFQVFQWITQPGWDIEAHRYTAIVPQAAVKFFALFGPGLNVLLIVASLAHALVGYGIFILCAHIWRSPIAAFGCALAAVLCSRLAFYSPVLEANYLLCYPFLFIGFVERRGRTGAFSPGAIALAAALALVALIVHPAGWMVMLFATAFLFAIRVLPIKAFIAMASFTLLWPLLARWIFPPTGYELEQYAAVAAGLGRMADLPSWGSWRFLVMHTCGATVTYLPALLVSLVVFIGWVRIGSWRVASLCLLGVLAFVAVYLVTFHGGNSAVMQDRGILPVATIIALGASALLMRIPAGVWRPVALGLAIIVLFVKARDVSFASRGFVKHLKAQQELIAQASEQRIPRGIVDCGLLRERDIEASWAFPAETLLRSAVMPGVAPCVLVCSDNLPAPHMLDSGQVQILQFAWAVDKNGNPYFRPSHSPYQALHQP